LQVEETVLICEVTAMAPVNMLSRRGLRTKKFSFCDVS